MWFPQKREMAKDGHGTMKPFVGLSSRLAIWGRE